MIEKDQQTPGHCTSGSSCHSCSVDDAVIRRAGQRLVLDPLSGRKEVEARFADGPVERPPHWLGYCLKPQTIEFWQDRPHRLHERRLFTRGSDEGGGGWTSTLLYP